jgi:hypothetical protein
MEGWAFTKDRDGWRWLWLDRAGNLVKTSSCPLRSLLECVRDAMKHGYSIVPPTRARLRDD